MQKSQVKLNLKLYLISWIGFEPKFIPLGITCKTLCVFLLKIWPIIIIVKSLFTKIVLVLI